MKRNMKKIVVNLEEDLKKFADQKAKEEYRTLTNYIANLIRQQRNQYYEERNVRN